MVVVVAVLELEEGEEEVVEVFSSTLAVEGIGPPSRELLLTKDRMPRLLPRSLERRSSVEPPTRTSLTTTRSVRDLDRRIVSTFYFYFPTFQT